MNNDGTAFAGSGATGANRLNEGTYEVSFDRDISGCARIVSNGFVVGAPSAIAINATFHTTVITPSNVVQVEVWEGEEAGSQTDTSFHLALFC